MSAPHRWNWLRARALGVLWEGTGHGLATVEDDRVRNLLALADGYADVGISAMVAVELPGRGRRVLLGGSRGPLLTELLLLVDVDHFKAINDQHGHAAGDAVLVQVAERLRQVEGLRSALIRWGGEEFLLVLPDADPAAAADRVAAALRSVSATPVAIDGKSLDVRCSIGYTRCRPLSEGFDPHIDLVISRADSALYQAKRLGRDRAVESGA
jgi:diguanylate cyclase (GGDEF)-like protein